MRESAEACLSDVLVDRSVVNVGTVKRREPGIAASHLQVNPGGCSYTPAREQRLPQTPRVCGERDSKGTTS
jgi:hypothetical protein